MTCVDDFVVSVDSCGNLTNVEALCVDACEDGACVGCSFLGDTVCYDGDIYSRDDCGNIGALVEQCDEICVVGDDGASCEDAGDFDCEEGDGVACALGDMHEVDSCGNVQSDIAEDCPNGCSAEGCLDCVTRVVGTTCVGRAVHALIGGCSGVPVAGDKLVDCGLGCSAGACNRTECVPNTGRTCFGGNVYSVNSCNERGARLEICDGGSCSGGACMSITDPETEGGVVDGGMSEAGPSEAGPDAAVDSGSPEGGIWEAGLDAAVEASTDADAEAGD
jgi:hypothetical protein